MTWARDAKEAMRLRAALSLLAEFEIATVVTDGGSGKEFIDFLRAFPHFQVFEADTPGVWSQARHSILAACETGSRFILYTEPDKLEFFRDRLQAFIAEAPDDDEVGIVLASRSANSFATFPVFQQQTETAINQCCAEVAGQSADFSYGPFLLNRQLVAHLSRVGKDLGWGWRPYTFGLAHRSGYRIYQSEMELPCPLDQREDNPSERLYRMKQLSQSVHGLVASTITDINQ